MWLNLAGIGFGFVSYAFLTGNWAGINSFVCVLLFLKLVREAVEQRGIISALINLLLSRFGGKGSAGGLQMRIPWQKYLIGQWTPPSGYPAKAHRLRQK